MGGGGWWGKGCGAARVRVPDIQVGADVRDAGLYAAKSRLEGMGCAVVHMRIAHCILA